MLLLPCVVELSVDRTKAGGHAGDNFMQITRCIEEELASGEEPKKIKQVPCKYSHLLINPQY